MEVDEGAISPSIIACYRLAADECISLCLKPPLLCSEASLTKPISLRRDGGPTRRWHQALLAFRR